MLFLFYQHLKCVFLFIFCFFWIKRIGDRNIWGSSRLAMLQPARKWAPSQIFYRCHLIISWRYSSSLSLIHIHRQISFIIVIQLIWFWYLKCDWSEGTDVSVKVLSSAREDWAPETRQIEVVKEQIEGLSVRTKGKNPEVSLDEDRSAQAAWIRQYMEREEEEEEDEVLTFSLVYFRPCLSPFFFYFFFLLVCFVLICTRMCSLMAWYISVRTRVRDIPTLN